MAEEQEQPTPTAPPGPMAAPAVDMKTLVHPGDLLAAVRAQYGASASVLDFEVKQGTETVQGFASLMLRAKVTVGLADGDTAHTTLMVKRKPVVAAHAEMLDALGEVNLRESIFFNQILPMLEERGGQLPLVKPLVSHLDAILMEDLCARGYNTLCKSFLDIGRGGKVTLPVVRMVVRKLAKLHAASLGRDWIKDVPGFFDADPAMEGPTGEGFKTFINNTLQNTVVPVMKKFHSEQPDFERCLEFLTGPRWFEEAVKVVTNRDFQPRVVSHGDCWLNNIMFRTHPETGEVVDACFIDLQIVRFGSPALDLAYFLYSCTGADFRAQHESDVLRTYVDAFNCEAATTPDLMHLDSFVAEFERARFFGVAMSLTFRPIQYLTFFAIPEGGALSDEFFALVQTPSEWSGPTIKAYEEDELVKKEFDQLILHSMEVIKKHL